MKFGPAVILAILLAGCGREATGPFDPFPPAPDDTLPYVYAVPEEIGDGWATASLAEVGLSESHLTRLIDLIRTGVYPRIHGIVIAKDGRLVLEEYFNGRDFEAAAADSIIGPWTAFDRNTPHNIASATKSVTSILVGIALGQGLIASVDTPVMEFFPEYESLRTPRRDSIRIRDLLTMRSGLGWDETTRGYGEPGNDIYTLFRSAEPLGFILSKPIVASRGTQWVYSGANTILLGEIVARAADMALSRFGDEHLFAPLGIPSPDWVQLEDSLTYASGDLRLRPRDMAKIGQLIADGGSWNGGQVVSPEWVEVATTPATDTWSPGWAYGFQWWLNEVSVRGVSHASVWARGWGGQMITVVPGLRLVVVQTGGNYFTEDPANAVVKELVLPALMDPSVP